MHIIAKHCSIGRKNNIIQNPTTKMSSGGTVVKEINLGLHMDPRELKLFSTSLLWIIIQKRSAYSQQSSMRKKHSVSAASCVRPIKHR